MVTKKTAAVLVAGAALAVSGCGSDEPRPEKEAAAVTVALHVVERASAEGIYEASGTLRAKQTAVITSKIPGHVRELHVSAGDRVTLGETLALLEGADIEARLQGATAALREAEDAEREAAAGLDAATARAAVAESTFGRYRELEAKRAVTAQEIDEVESRHLSAKADLGMARARLSRARSSIERARAEIATAEAYSGYMRIQAPFDGRVIERHVDVGTLAGPGTPLLVLEQAGAVRAEVSVDESQAGRIHVGDEATVVVSGAVELKARVSEVFPAVDPASRAFLVKVDLPEDVDSSGFAPGRFVRVGFRIGERERMVVPDSAVMRRGQLELVYVVEDDRARLRLVTLGRSREGFVEVLSGLDPGEAVVVQAKEIADEGVRVAKSS
jgi:multidrug efflux pump subunit AcrA (membrane-fusion protein)